MKLEQVRELVQRFQDVTVKVYNNHAYASGYLGSMVSTMYLDLGKREQKLLIKQLEVGIESLEKTLLLEHLSVDKTPK